MRYAHERHPHPPRNGTGYAGVAGSAVIRLAVRAMGGLAAAALVAADAGSILGAVPAAAAAHGAAASSCTVRWTGQGDGQLWADPRNWSTGKVPGPSDNVCILSANINTNVTTLASIKIHSLLLGVENSIDLQGTTSKPVTASVATTVTMTRLAQAAGSIIQMTDATLRAGQIISHLGTIFTAGTCHIISPHIILADQSSLEAFNGTATLSSLPELSNGTLTGVGILADHAKVVLPGDITHLAATHINLHPGSALDDPAGHPALAGLTSIDARSSLIDFSNLTLTSTTFTADGQVEFGGGTFNIAGPFTQAAHTLSLAPQSTLSARSVTIDRGAGFADFGTVAADLINDGRLGATGTAHVTGNYTQAPGATLFSGFGNLLAVTGKAQLAGSISATEQFAKTGDTTQLITFGSLANDFTSHPLGLKLRTRAHEIDGIQVPQLAVSPTTVSPGQAVTMRGGGFTLNQDVRIFLDHASGTPLPTGVTVTNLAGGFMVTATIPASVAAGPHRLLAVATDGERASAPITVR
jgi:hypothetical protein